ncbi:MAG: ferrochelatase, partial [Methylococcales bacterium]|nr:ferrochelatase [Methylococcales bacterium]
SVRRSMMTGLVFGRTDAEVDERLSLYGASSREELHGIIIGTGPEIADQLAAILADKPDHLIVLPLYPQYSSTTSASVFDAVIDSLKARMAIPGLTWIRDFHHHPLYIKAIADSIRAAWAEHPPADKLVFSFHGLPKLLIDRGDPYFEQCHTSARLIAEHLKLPESRWEVVFQSRFGKAEWLKPYCVDTLIAYPGQGVKSVDILCPGFSVDCLETLEEIALANRDEFIEAGGEHYRYIPCLNDSEAHLALFEDLLNAHLAGH